MCTQRVGDRLQDLASGVVRPSAAGSLLSVTLPKDAVRHVGCDGGGSAALDGRPTSRRRHHGHRSAPASLGRPPAGRCAHHRPAVVPTRDCPDQQLARPPYCVVVSKRRGAAEPLLSHHALARWNANHHKPLSGRDPKYLHACIFPAQRLCLPWCNTERGPSLPQKTEIPVTTS